LQQNTTVIRVVKANSLAPPPDNKGCGRILQRVTELAKGLVRDRVGKSFWVHEEHLLGPVHPDHLQRSRLQPCAINGGEDFERDRDLASARQDDGEVALQLRVAIGDLYVDEVECLARELHAEALEEDWQMEIVGGLVGCPSPGLKVRQGITPQVRVGTKRGHLH